MPAVRGGGAGGTSTDLLVANLDSVPLKFRPLIVTQFTEETPAISYDDRYLAYTVNESGVGDVWVTTFPETSKPVRISNGNAIDPAWSPDGKTLYYRANQKLIAARLGAGLKVLRTDTLFSTAAYPRNLALTIRSYDLSRDGRKFFFGARRIVTSADGHVLA